MIQFNLLLIYPCIHWIIFPFVQLFIQSFAHSIDHFFPHSSLRSFLVTLYSTRFSLGRSPRGLSPVLSWTVTSFFVFFAVQLQMDGCLFWFAGPAPVSAEPGAIFGSPRGQPVSHQEVARVRDSAPHRPPTGHDFLPARGALPACAWMCVCVCV